MAYQNEMVDITKTAEKVQPYVNWMPANTGEVMKKVPQDSLKSHQNSHDK